MTATWYRCLGLLPFFFLAWTCLANIEALRSGWRRLPLTLVLGTSFLIALTALSANFTHRLTTSYWLGSGFCLLGAVACFLLRPQCLRAHWNIRWDVWLGVTLLVSAGITATVIRIAWRFAFHDQMWIQAHPPLVESLLRENFPPGLMAFPETPLKYHWGADLFGALMSYCLEWPAYKAIDVTMAFGIVLWQWNVYLFFRLLGLNRAFSLAGLLWILLGAGWGYYLDPWLQTQGGSPILWPGSQLSFNRHLSPSNLYNFFMTPYSLGMGFFFGGLAVAHESLRSHRLTTWAIFAWLLGVLSFIQVSFFPTLLCGILAAMAFQALHQQVSWRQTVIRTSLVASLSLVLAYSLGGFFTRSTDYESDLLLFTWPPGYLSNATVGGNFPLDWGQAGLWYLASMGSVLILTFPCSVYLIRDSWKKHEATAFLLLVFLLQSTIIPQFFRYKLSWDIIKWFISLQVAAQTLIVIAWARLNVRFRVLGVIFSIFLILDCIPNVRFAYTLAFASPQEAGPGYRAWWSRVINPPSRGLAQLISLLKTGSSKEIVMGPYDLIESLTRHSGQSTAWFDQNTFMFGVKQGILDARKNMTHASPIKPPLDLWRRAGISWWIFPCGEPARWSGQIKERLEKWIDKGEVEKFVVDDPKNCWEAYRAKSPYSIEVKMKSP